MASIYRNEFQTVRMQNYEPGIYWSPNRKAPVKNDCREDKVQGYVTSSGLS